MLDVATPDPADARLLALVAEVGRVAVHDLARRAGMDVREVAARLAGLAATGLPLVVGVECDPTTLRHTLASWAPPGPRHGGWDTQRPEAPDASGGRHTAPPTGPTPVPGYGSAPGYGPEPGWGPVPGYGPDQELDATPRPRSGNHASSGRRVGAPGEGLDGAGPAGEPLTVRLVEVLDPADGLFTEAGYRLRPGQRCVVVHTELTNRAAVPLDLRPDEHLVLLDGEGNAVPSAPVSLPARPAHRASPQRVALPPGETAGGHTVFLLPARARLSAVRWTAGPAARPSAARGDGGPAAETPVLTWTLGG